MCILFIYVNAKPQPGQYRLVLASNRDEYYHRLSSPIHKWSIDECIVAGQDLEGGFEGGTWLGLSTKNTDHFRFRVGCLLNLTGEHRTKGAPGRGALVTNFLKSEQSCSDYTADLVGGNVPYNAFNFVSVQLSNNEEAETCYYTNRPNSSVCIKGEEFMGFSNSLLHVPLRKVSVGKERFRGVVQRLGVVEKCDKLVEELTELLQWSEQHLPDPELQRRAEFAHEYLSSIFVHIENAAYGTRAHSVMLVDFEWNVKYVEVAMEQPYDEKTKKWTKVVVNSKA